MKRSQRIRREFAAARKIWPRAVHGIQSDQLDLLLKTYRFSVGRGDLQILGGRWYVTTHLGLLGVAARRRCCGIHTEAVEKSCEKTACRWTFKAVVYKSSNCKGFAGYGDADPSNVSPLVHGAEMREILHRNGWNAKHVVTDRTRKFTTRTFEVGQRF